VSTAFHHVLLALTGLGILETGLRIASRATPSGLERAIAAVVIAVTIVVVETLALGLVGLGASTIALVAAAALTWAIGASRLPAPRVRPTAELIRWWRELDRGLRVGAAALAGGGAALTAWVLRYPSIGFDSALYHYAQVAGWIQNGRPGSILFLSYDLPYGNYPLTDEVALTWAAAISRSFVPLVLWNPLLLVVLGLASWVTVRNLGVPRLPAGLAVAALVSLPLAVHQLNEPQTDVPALAWLACTSALCSGARRTPALMAPALLAAGLAVGTKTTTAVLVAVSLGVGFFFARGSLLPLVRWLALATAGAFTIGGIWYARNLLQHGSPLWPFAAAPWGDPRPRFLELVDARFLERPAASLNGRWGTYASQLAGAIVLLAGALAVLVRGALAFRLPRRLRLELVVVGSVSLLALLAWSLAPGTGLPTSPGLLAPESWPLSTLRYLLPAIGAATVAVAVAARAGGVTAASATLALAAATAWNVVEAADLGLPYVPSAETVAVGAAAGLAVLAVALLASRRAPGRGWGGLAVAGAPVVVVAAVVAGLALAPAGQGFVERHSGVTGSTALGRGVAAWFAAQPGFDGGGMTIAFASRAVQAPLAGDHFTHPLELLPARASCAEVRARARRSAIVVTDPAFLRGLLGDRPYDAGRCLAGRRPSYRDEAFSVYPPHPP
jgi:hypothetical protein